MGNNEIKTIPSGTLRRTKTQTFFLWLASLVSFFLAGKQAWLMANLEPHSNLPIYCNVLCASLSILNVIAVIFFWLRKKICFTIFKIVVVSLLFIYGLFSQSIAHNEIIHTLHFLANQAIVTSLFLFEKSEVIRILHKVKNFMGNYYLFSLFFILACQSVSRNFSVMQYETDV